MISKSRLDASLRLFIGWLDRNGTSGYDPYDLWSTSYGKLARRLYYRFGTPAALFSLPVLLADRLIPQIGRSLIDKKPFATSHAHLILAYLELLGLEDRDRISRASALADELYAMKIDGYSGACWGYPFDWVNRRGTWPKGTPLITVTPYCFEAYLALYLATSQEKYRDVARSIVEFALNDLKIIRRPSGSIASSYSPIDNSLIVNASAYRAFLLFRAWREFGITEAKDTAEGLIKFVIESQCDDGSWPYAVGAKGDDFVDHFHTCFVLKNLVRISELQEDEDLTRAIEKGYSFYERELFDIDGLPRPFAKGGNRLLKYNLYDFAEAINLGVLLRDRFPQAFERALFIARETIERFQLPQGYFITSVGRAGLADKMPYIRWPQAQLFHALASVRRVLS